MARETLLSRATVRAQTARHADAQEEKRQRQMHLLKEELYKILTPEQIAALLVSDVELARAEVEEVLRKVATVGAARVALRDEREQLVQLLASEVLGLGAIDRLIADASVTEIMVNGPYKIFFEREGKLMLSPQRYSSEEQLRMVIDRIISPLGRRIDEQNPLVNGRLPQGHRVNAIIPPLVLDGSALTIRKFRDEVLSLDELVEMGSIDEAAATLLRWAVAATRNIAVSGGTGSGKTTLLNALSCEIAPDERIITIEDSAELKFHAHPHVVRLEARPANLEGKGAVTIRDLVINTLRMRPDRIVVGEVRGAEALEMLQAMNTGHDGSLTTLHANSPREVMARLVTMVGYGADLPAHHVEAQIASALDLIVHTERGSDGVRRVSEIVEIPSGNTIYRFEQTGTRSDGRVVGRPLFLSPPVFLNSLVARGLADETELTEWYAATNVERNAATNVERCAAAELAESADGAAEVDQERSETVGPAR